ncbi:MAG: MmcQ/YjbR family DNA-binding protein [Bradymonadaceae bacterium]|nr:MmcQ/YjbR family DNA-binding protein [Lujinxingiaceae bacterium]
MDLEDIRQYCLEKPAVSEDFPFDQDTLAFRVKRKIFLLTNIEAFPARINLKCDPARAVELREEHPSAILPGYHMNKKHWNTVILDGTLTEALIYELVDHSYDLIVASLTKAERDTL